MPGLNGVRLAKSSISCAPQACRKSAFWQIKEDSDKADFCDSYLVIPSEVRRRRNEVAEYCA